LINFKRNAVTAALGSLSRVGGSPDRDECR
jgi:hypothetical protein